MFGTLHLSTKAEVIIKKEFDMKVSWSARREIRQLSKSITIENEYDIAISYVINVLKDLPVEERYERTVLEKIEIAKKLMDYAQNRGFIKIILSDIERAFLEKKEPVRNNDSVYRNDDIIECPMCAEDIKANAKICRHCRYDLINEVFLRG